MEVPYKKTMYFRSVIPLKSNRAGDINYTPYYNVHFVHDSNGHMKGDLIDAKFY